MIRDRIRRRRDGGRDALVASMEDLAGTARPRGAGPGGVHRQGVARAAHAAHRDQGLRLHAAAGRGRFGEGRQAGCDRRGVRTAVLHDREPARAESRPRGPRPRLRLRRSLCAPCVEEVAERLRAVARHRDVGVDVEWSWRRRDRLGRREPGPAGVREPDRKRHQVRPARNGRRRHGRHRPTASVAVSVEDRGRGIAEADLPFIFDEFFQAPERSEPGAGLGLAIARELTEAHGGRIDVSSRVGEGTRFTVTLPTTDGARDA